jgi:uncharacterized Zn-binding protein involved in type VI secretion
MGQPAAATGDKVVGTCAVHLIPNPTSGAPQPGPPVPFSAPLLVATCPTVLVGGSPAVVVGAQGINTPPHVGLHPTDPFFVPAAQQGIVTMGSTTVLFGGQPAVRAGDPATCCGQPVGTVMGTKATVLIG